MPNAYFPDQSIQDLSDAKDTLRLIHQLEQWVDVVNDGKILLRESEAILKDAIRWHPVVVRNLRNAEAAFTDDDEILGVLEEALDIMNDLFGAMNLILDANNRLKGQQKL
ncbi:hypothetical protein M426DRAFT_12628 [Hypoxylon sp. CI-4A]|nr:hypothetical protein M426DRAFT_12628 [Hypoxylon sp. CI-4A]